MDKAVLIAAGPNASWTKIEFTRALFAYADMLAREKRAGQEQ
jgi:hypothetical protein